MVSWTQTSLNPSELERTDGEREMKNWWIPFSRDTISNGHSIMNIESHISLIFNSKVTQL